MEQDEEKTVLEKFKVICRKCGSERIEMEDSRGYSEESGVWGDVYFLCVDCGEREAVTSDY